jgi:HEAT repeat protein
LTNQLPSEKETTMQPGDYIDDNFARDVAQGHVGLFVGAGLSTYSKLPLQSELEQRLRANFGDLENGKTGPDLFDDCVAIHKQGPVTRWLIEQLGGARPSEVHTLIADLNFRWLFTTNYDALLERKLRLEHGSDLLVIEDETDIFLESYFAYRIVKLHGSVERPSTLRVTKRQMVKLLVEPSQILGTLRDRLSRGPFLFLGYSLTDFTWLGEYLQALKMQGGEPQWRYLAVIKDAKRPDTERLRDLGIHVIPTDALSFLLALRDHVDRLPKDTTEAEHHIRALTAYRELIDAAVAPSAKTPPLRLADNPTERGPLRSAVDPIVEALEHDSRILLMGPIGAGKATVVRRAAAQMLDTHQLDRLPVFLHLSKFSHDNLVDFVRTTLRDRVEFGSAELLQHLRKGHGFLVLEGLEVANGRYDRLLEELEDVSTAFPHCKVVVTCTASEDAAVPKIPGFRRLWVAPLSQSEIRAIAIYRLNEPDGERFAEVAFGGHRIPLGGGIAAGPSNLDYFLDRPRPSQLLVLCDFWKNNSGALPGRTDLYKRLTGDALASRFPVGSQELAMTCLLALAKYVYQIDPNRAITRNRARSIVSAAIGHAASETDAEKMLLDLTKTGLLLLVGADEVSFSLPGLAAFLVAKGICDGVGAGASETESRITAMMERSKSPRENAAREALTFIATLMDDPTRLVEKLIDEDLVFAAQAIHDMPDKVSDSVLTAFVEQAMESFIEDRVDFEHRFMLERLDDRCLTGLLRFAGAREDVAVRRWAGRAICQNQSPRSIDRLIAEVDSSTSPVRWECAWAMFEIGINRPEAPVRLAKHFADKFEKLGYYGFLGPAVKGAVGTTLAEAFKLVSRYMAGDIDAVTSSDPGWIGHLVERSIARKVLAHAQQAGSQDQDVALMFLGYLGGPDASEIIEFLAEYLRNESNPNRFCAASSLGVLKASGQADLLWAYVEGDRDPNVRLYSAAALDRMVAFQVIEEEWWLPKATAFLSAGGMAAPIVVPMLSSGRSPDGPRALVDRLRRGDIRLIEKQAIADQLAYAPRDTPIEAIETRLQLLRDAHQNCSQEELKWLTYTESLVQTSLQRRQQAHLTNSMPGVKATATGRSPFSEV